jgi:hypothetical protein
MLIIMMTDDKYTDVYSTVDCKNMMVKLMIMRMMIRTKKIKIKINF